MKPLVFLVILLTSTISLWGQDEDLITIEYCRDQAVSNHPLYKQFELIDESGDLQLENISKNYLPDIRMKGQIHYQSDVTQLPESPMPGFDIEPIDKDWYKVYVDVSQFIYDGGLTKSAKQLEHTETNISSQNIRLNLYELKKRVDLVYFQILLLQENKLLLEAHKNVINSRLKEVESAVRNGVVLESNADILKAELLNVDQLMTEVEVGMNASFTILEELMSVEIPNGTQLAIPEIELELGQYGKQRLEYGLFDYQKEQIDAMKQMTNAKNIPKFAGFGQLGYGRPGYNMLDNTFQDFWMVGIRMDWKILNWNKVKNEKTILDLNKEMLDNQVETFDKNLKIEAEQKSAEVLKFEELIKKDAEILELRSKIAKTSAAQMEHGVITATEYIAEQRAETEAKLNMEKHKIQLVRAKMDYLAAIGDL